jgi:hypothetical protein
VALAAAHLGGGRRATDEERRGWTAAAEKWAGRPVPAWAEGLVDAARLDPVDRTAAREALSGTPIDPRLADGLLAAVSARPDAQAPPAIVEAARALAAVAPG